jgi:3-oxoacyl-[acyl-carrier-protein] synthase III
MLSVHLKGVRLLGSACAVPYIVRTVEDDCKIFGEEEALKISASTGIKRRYASGPYIYSSDLCVASAKKLMSELNWSPESVGAVIYVSQSFDYGIPPTAPIIHHRLGLPKGCIAFDVNLGCSGYTYGLWMVANLMKANGIKRGILVTGDTASKGVSPQDRATYVIFGDAGNASALELDDSASPMHFVLGSDGGGYRHIIVPVGASRHPKTAESQKRVVRDDGNIRSDEDTFMNGAEVFAFTLREIPGLIRNTLETAGWKQEEVDMFVFHQANTFMLKHLAKKLKLPPEKVILNLEGYGNTSCASIPLAMTTEVRNTLRTESKNLLMAGFGIGLSWASLAVRTDKLVMPELITVNNDGLDGEIGPY